MLLCALRLPGFFKYHFFGNIWNKTFSNWRGLSAEKSSCSPPLLSATTWKTRWAISTRSKAVFYEQSLTHKRHLSLPLPTQPFLCSGQPCLYSAQRLFSSFTERSLGKQAVLGSTAFDGIYRLGKTKKKVTNRSSRDKHRSRLVGGRRVFKRSGLCVRAVDMDPPWEGTGHQIPPKTGRSKEKDLFGFF